MFFFPVLILLSGDLSGASMPESTPTYEHQDRLTGQTLICTTCPPGTHMVSHCTATKPTECTPCEDNHFTELWNYLHRCLYCSNLCFGNQEVEKECSRTANRVCRCKEGLYWNGDFCIKHSKCRTGHGVKTKGTAKTDTVCEKCVEGFFSSSSSALDSCKNKNKCATGQLVILRDSIHHDTICVDCEDIESGGETYRAFLSEFFNIHILRRGRMRKLVTRYIHFSGKEMRLMWGTGLPKQRGLRPHQIRAWLAKLPKEQLRNLPNSLRASRLHSMAKQLEGVYIDFEQQSPNCTLV